MSFYSALVLAANAGARAPSPHAVQALFLELGLLDPAKAGEPFGNLAGDVTDLFADEGARAANDRFFCPDSLSFDAGVEIEWADGDYAGAGCSVRIHGNGYFFPWAVADLRDRAIRSPKLRRLRQAVQERFGGSFAFPPAEESALRQRCIDGENGWVWFASESL
jgi:hypothetical protein